MFIQQLYTSCLAQAAYYIESGNEAAIIDPLRDFHQYIDLAKSRGAKIKYIFETHFHADFVSGHLDLSKESGAPIIFGPEAKTGFESTIAKDAQIFNIGELKIKLLHTPGHTPESSCYLLFDEKGNEHAIFTGDTLFVGDVGRPDLLDGILSSEDLAGMMFSSLNEKIKTLPDEVIVYPGHGPGSACGKNIGKETFSTIGTQKKNNYALQDQSKEEFIKQVTDGIQAPPEYFFKDASLNKNGYAPVDDLVKKGLNALSASEFKNLKEKGAVIIDTRIPDEFEKGFVKGSLNFGLNGQYAIWAATLLDLNTPLILVTDEGKESESVTRLSRVGFDNIQGYLKGGFEAWKNEGYRIDMVISIDMEEFELDQKFGNIEILDVRKPGEFNDAHVTGASNFSLQDIPSRSHELNPEHTYYIHCAGGYRSMIAASYLKTKGIDKVKNILGGFSKIKETKIPVSTAKKESKAEN